MIYLRRLLGVDLNTNSDVDKGNRNYPKGATHL